jgi:hypothetical protein
MEKSEEATEKNTGESEHESSQPPPPLLPTGDVLLSSSP